MSAETADRRKAQPGDTVRLSAVHMIEDLTAIGRYEILSELGQGAMARVYLAQDPNIHRKVALKVLEPRGLVAAIEMDELRTRFLLEARAAGNLRHPCAVAIYDADHDSATGLSFIAMEWVDGQSLDGLLKQESKLTPNQAAAITCQMASALDAAHAQGLIHRDVKPANILLDGQNNAKLSDFGIAKAESLELTSTGQVLGTPFYMSPEQIRDEDLDGRSDLFSLGVVLYQSLTGTQPFRADSLPALTHKILHVDPAPPQSLNPEIPGQLASTILKALEKDPGRRFQSGAELAEALGGEVLPATSTINLTHPSMHAHTRAMAAGGGGQSRKWWGLVGSVLAAIILIAALAGLWQEEQPSEAPQPEAAVATVAPQPVVEQTDAGSSADTGTSSTAAFNSALQISYTNRLKKATLDVWVDGKHVLSRGLSSPRGFFKRAVGQSTLASVPVSAGYHEVKVSIRGSAGKIEASNRSANNFEDGQTRRLRVELIPPSYLKMAWK